MAGRSLPESGAPGRQACCVGLFSTSAWLAHSLDLPTHGLQHSGAHSPVTEHSDAPYFTWAAPRFAPDCKEDGTESPQLLKPTSCSFRGFCFTSTSGWGGESCGCVRELKKAESTGRAKLSNYQRSTASPGHSKGPMIPPAVSPRLNSSDEEYGLSDRASSCA